MLFSVIIPTHNRLFLLKQTISSLLRQSISDYEIIIVDDGSTDGTAEYLKTLNDKDKIITLFQKNKGPASARNKGLKLARGKYIAFTDDDCVVPSDWLEKIQVHFDIRKIAGVGGPVTTGNKNNLCSLANDIIVNFLKNELNVNHNVKPPFLTSNNIAYSKIFLDLTGGFDENFFIGAEERDLNHRIFLEGGELIYDPDLIIEHNNDSNFINFLKHQFDQGKGSYRYYSKLNKMKVKQSKIPLLVYGKMFLYPFKVERIFRSVALFFLFIMAQIFITAGYFLTAIKTGRE